jgi:hypothetical protein
MPRAATSVAMQTRARPSRMACSAWVRSFWLSSPDSATTEKPRLLQAGRVRWFTASRVLQKTMAFCASWKRSTLMMAFSRSAGGRRQRPVLDVGVLASAAGGDAHGVALVAARGGRWPSARWPRTSACGAFRRGVGTPVHLSHVRPEQGLRAKKVLDNIHLSFYPDAKIGILGPNGSGKSTILRIMAGIDKEFTGEAWLAEGATVGYLPQEPQLDPRSRRASATSWRASKKTAIIERYNELMMNYSDETADEAPSSRTRWTARTCGTSNSRSRWRWRRSAARPAMPT